MADPVFTFANVAVEVVERSPDPGIESSGQGSAILQTEPLD